MPHIHLCNIVCRAVLTLSFASVANDPDYLHSVNTPNYLDSSTHDASFELMVRPFNTALQLYNPYPVYTLFHCLNEGLGADDLAAFARDTDLDDVDDPSTDTDTRLIVEVPTLVTSPLYTMMSPQVIPSPPPNLFATSEDIWSTIEDTPSFELLADIQAERSSTSVKLITATICLHARMYMAAIVRGFRFRPARHRLLLFYRSKTVRLIDTPLVQSVMRAVARWPMMKLAACVIHPLIVGARQLASSVRKGASSMDNVSVIAVYKLLYGLVTFAILVSVAKDVYRIAPTYVLKAKRKVWTVATTMSRFPTCILVFLRATLSSMSSGMNRVNDLPSGAYALLNGRVSASLSSEKLETDPVLFTDKDNELNDPMPVSLPANADYRSVLVVAEARSPSDQDKERCATLLEYYSYVQAMTRSLGNTPSGRLLRAFYRLLVQAFLALAMNVRRVLPGCVHQVGGHALSHLKLRWRYALKGKVIFINFPPNGFRPTVLKCVVSIVQYALSSLENTPSGRLIKAAYSLSMPLVMAFAYEVSRITTNCLHKVNHRPLHFPRISFRGIQGAFRNPLSFLHSSATSVCSRVYVSLSSVVSHLNHWKNALHARYMQELQHVPLHSDIRSSSTTSISSRVFAIVLLDSLKLLWTGRSAHEMTPPSTCELPSKPIDPIFVPLPVADDHELDIDPALVPLPLHADDEIEFNAANVLLPSYPDDYVHVDPTPITHPVDADDNTNINATCVHFPPDLEEGTESGPSHVQEPALEMNGAAWLRGHCPSMSNSGEGIVEGGRIELNLATLDALYPLTSLDDLRAPSTVQHAFDSHAVDKHMHLTVETAHIRLLTVELDLDPVEIQLPDDAYCGVSLDSSCVALRVDADERMELDPLTVPLPANCDDGLEVSSGANGYNGTLALGSVILASDKGEEAGLGMLGNSLEDVMTNTSFDLFSAPSYDAVTSDNALDLAVAPLLLDIDHGGLLDACQVRSDTGEAAGLELESTQFARDGNGTTGFGHDMALARKLGGDVQRGMVITPSFYVGEAAERDTADGTASHGPPTGAHFAVLLDEPARLVEPMDRLVGNSVSVETCLEERNGNDEADLASSNVGAMARDEVQQTGTSYTIDPTIVSLPLDADDGIGIGACRAPFDMDEHIAVGNSVEQLREDADAELQSTQFASRVDDTADEAGGSVADVDVVEWFERDSSERDELARLVETMEDPDGASAFDSGVVADGSLFEQDNGFDGAVLVSSTSDVMSGDNVKQVETENKEADSSWLSDEVTFVSHSDGSEEGCPGTAYENLEIHSTVKWEVESFPIWDDVLDICTRDETELFDDCMYPPVVRISEGNCYRRFSSDVNESFMRRSSAQDDSALVTTTKTDLLHESWTKVSTCVVRLGSCIRPRSGEASTSTKTDTDTTTRVLEPVPVLNWADDVEASTDGVSVKLNRRGRKAERKRLAMLAAGISMPTNSGTGVDPSAALADDVEASANGVSVPLNRRQRKAERKRLAMLAAGLPYRRNGWARHNAADNMVQGSSNTLQRRPGTAHFRNSFPQDTRADHPFSRERGFNGQGAPQTSHAGPSRAFLAQGQGQGQASQDWRQRPNEHQEISPHRRRQHQEIPFRPRRQHHSIPHAPFASGPSSGPGYRTRQQQQPRPANEVLEATGVHQSNTAQQSLPSGDVRGDDTGVSPSSPRPVRAHGSCDIPGANVASTVQASRRRNNSGSNQHSGSQHAVVRSSVLHRANHADHPGGADSIPSVRRPTARIPNIWVPPWNNARRLPSRPRSAARPQVAGAPQQ